MRTLVAAVGALAAVSSAHAAVTGFFWREIPNTQGARPGSNPNNDATHGVDGDGRWSSRTWRTFDLLVIGAVGDTVYGVSFGGDGGVERIYTDGVVFNHDFGSDTRSSLAAERQVGNSALLFDTYVEFGGRALPGQGGTSAADPGTNTPGTFGGFAGAVNLTGANGELQFTAFAPAGSPAALVADSVFGGSLRVLRVTIADATYLGGVGAVGLSGGVVARFSLGYPSPGPVALLGIAGIAAARRRR